MFPQRTSSLLASLRSSDRQVPWISSVIVHVTLLTLLSLIALRADSDARPVAIETRIAGDELVEIETTLQKIATSDEGNDGGARSPSVFLDATTQSRPDPAPHAELAQPVELSLYANVAAGSLTAHVGDFSSGRGGQQASADGTGDKGTGTGSGFFGSKISGKRVVFVVDASRSMNLIHPGPARTRFKRVQLELVQAIAQMTEDQQFFVIFFNSAAWPMPADQPVNATPQARQFYLRWVASASAEGTTLPGPAIALALNMNPDVIYFLTDGRFDPRVVPLTAQLNQGRATIHTIGFADNGGEMMLSAIATQNGGRYRFISPEESADAPEGSAIEQVGRTASTDPTTAETSADPATQ